MLSGCNRPCMIQWTENIIWPIPENICPPCFKDAFDKCFSNELSWKSMPFYVQDSIQCLGIFVCLFLYLHIKKMRIKIVFSYFHLNFLDYWWVWNIFSFLNCFLNHFFREFSIAYLFTERHFYLFCLPIYVSSFCNWSINTFLTYLL